MRRPNIHHAAARVMVTMRRMPAASIMDPMLRVVEEKIAVKRTGCVQRMVRKREWRKRIKRTIKMMERAGLVPPRGAAEVSG